MREFVRWVPNDAVGAISRVRKGKGVRADPCVACCGYPWHTRCGGVVPHVAAKQLGRIVLLPPRQIPPASPLLLFAKQNLGWSSQRLM